METAAKIAAEHQFILRKYGACSPQLLLAETLMARDWTNEALLHELRRIYVTGQSMGASHASSLPPREPMRSRAAA